MSALIFIVNDPLNKIGNIQTFNFTVFGMENSLFYALLALLSFIVILFIRIPRYSKIVRDRMIAFSIFCLFTVFFWAGFEQGAGSLPIYTRDFTDRFLEGGAATLFKITDLLVTVIPLAIITYVLINLFRITYRKIALSNTILGLSLIHI